MPLTLQIASGASVTVNYASNTDQNPGISETVGVSADGVDLTTNVPAIMPVTASTGIYDWNDPAAWSDAYIVVQGFADVSDFIADVFSGQLLEACETIPTDFN